MKVRGLFFSVVLLMSSSLAVAKATKHKKGVKKVEHPIVMIETSLGNIEVELDANKAPVTVENFLKYVDAGFYSGTIFHRVIKGFMIQGGGFDENMHQKDTRAPIKNEADNGLHNKKYTIAMARTNDINSATAQFFINTADNGFLDYKGPASFGYAVFGKVIHGQDVVDKIESSPTTMKNGMQDVPVKTVVIKAIKVWHGKTAEHHKSTEHHKAPEHHKSEKKTSAAEQKK